MHKPSADVLSLPTCCTQGNVTAGQVFTVYPFANTLGLIQMNGSAILASIEWGVSAVGTSAGTGRFPQVCLL